MIKSENYLTIQGWMITELNLSGNDLMLYALIYGFSQTTDTMFSGSLKYIMSWLNCSKNGAIKNLNSLCQKGLIIKHTKTENNMIVNQYQVVPKSELVYHKVVGGVPLSGGGGVPLSGPNNTNYNNTIIDNTIDNISGIEKNEFPKIKSDLKSDKSTKLEYSVVKEYFDKKDYQNMPKEFKNEYSKDIFTLYKKLISLFEPYDAQISGFGFIAAHEFKKHIYGKFGPKELELGIEKMLSLGLRRNMNMALRLKDCIGFVKQGGSNPQKNSHSLDVNGVNAATNYTKELVANYDKPQSFK